MRFVCQVDGRSLGGFAGPLELVCLARFWHLVALTSFDLFF